MASKFTLACFIFLLASCILIYLMFYANTNQSDRKFKQGLDENSSERNGDLVTGSSDLNRDTTTPSISRFVRMTGRLNHKTRFYCNLFRTTVLFWPSSFGKTVVVLDEESQEDHDFGKQLKQLTTKYFPSYKVDVKYEPLPSDKTVLDFPGRPGSPTSSPGYNRQLWSSFFIDLFTDDSVVAWMDTDTTFIIPVAQSSILYNGPKVRILGSGCTKGIYNIVTSWARTTEMAIGYPMVADFMTYFPAYIYRDTFTHCREHILERFKTTNFEEAFKKFYHAGTGYLSPVNVIISYAWYFERDRYDWNVKICRNLESYNTFLPSGQKLEPKDVKQVLPQPQTAYHGFVEPGHPLGRIPEISFCRSQMAADRKPEICTNYTASNIDDMLMLFNDDFQSGRLKRSQTQCTGTWKNYCLKILDDYYNNLGDEIKSGKRKLSWGNLKTVGKVVFEAGVTCPPSAIRIL